MGKRDELNELIYEYYESRILFGIYKYGEQLKSVPQICTLFMGGQEYRTNCV